MMMGKVRIPLLTPIIDLINLIETLQPDRIASIHAHRIPDRALVEMAKNQKKVVALPPDFKDNWDSDRHAVKGIDWPGIYVDPRYVYDPRQCATTGNPYDTNACKFNRLIDPAFPTQSSASLVRMTGISAKGEGTADDALALKVAQAVFNADDTKKLNPGNHFWNPPPVLHYAQSAPAEPGFSLGDWGPVAVQAGRK